MITRIAESLAITIALKTYFKHITSFARYFSRFYTGISSIPCSLFVTCCACVAIVVLPYEKGMSNIFVIKMLKIKVLWNPINETNK